MTRHEDRGESPIAGKLEKGTLNARGTLKEGEPHPAATDALAFIGGLSRGSLAMWQESFSSCAIEGNRLAEVCSETLRRLRSGEPVSDRYLLGLAWCLREETRSAAFTGAPERKLSKSRLGID